MRKRKLVFGIGVNDADYTVKPTINGSRVVCVFYLVWQSMLKRCYSEKYHAEKPTYIGCTVCDEWLTFSNFKKWMELQDYEGKQLDKDILISGNKVYSPDTCIFISSAINLLLNSREAARGKYKQGVTWDKRRNKFKSQTSLFGRTKTLGRYSAEQEAYTAYVAAKADYIREVADTQEPRVRAGLYRHAAELENTLK